MSCIELNDSYYIDMNIISITIIIERQGFLHVRYWWLKFVALVLITKYCIEIKGGIYYAIPF